MCRIFAIFVYSQHRSFSHSFCLKLRKALGLTKKMPGFLGTRWPRGLNPIWDSQQFDFQLGDDVDPILRIEAA